MSDTCGPTSGMPLAQYDREQRCWRTSEVTSLWALPMSSLTLPTWGCLRDGVLYELPTPAPATDALDYSSLPTPQARDYKDETLPKPHGQHSPSLPVMLRTLPTPKAADGERGRDLSRLRPDTQSRELATVLTNLPTPRAAHGEERNQTIYKRKGVDDWQGSRLNLENALALLPTPAVNDMGAGKDPNAWQEWAARQKASDGRPAPHGKSLEQEALSLGAHTAPPLSDGKPSLDDLLQPLPFNETTATD